MGGHRARLSRKLSDADAIDLFARTHIVQVRRRKNGEIVLVKHCTWGWIDPKMYYAMQKFEDALPKIIEGGYRLKQAIFGWEIDLEILASGVKLPAGIALVAGALALAALDEAEGHPEKAALDVLALALPFGELWLLYRGVLAATEVQGAVGGIAAAVGGLIRGFLPPILPDLPSQTSPN